MTIELRAFTFPPYAQMVENLFKKDLPGNHSMLLHAAIGIAGEGSELKEVNSRKNFLEECGDLEFYICAAWLYLGHMQIPIPNTAPTVPLINLETWANVVQNSGGKFLDATKKAWVYGNREPNYPEVFNLLSILRLALDFAYELHGTTLNEVMYLNQVKLIGKDGRYKNGTYSDAEALARNDKKAEEGVEHQPRFAEALALDSSNVANANNVLGSMTAVK